MAVLSKNQLQYLPFKLTIYSNKTGKVYDIYRISSYMVDIDLEMDTDRLDITIENMNGMWNGLINKFDKFDVHLNKTPIMKGTIDAVKYHDGESSSTVKISGRNVASALIDNDALPRTMYNIKPSSYIAKRCQEYGIPKHKLDTSVPTQKKLIIGTRESEMSICHNLVIKPQKRIWVLYDTLYMGDWDTGASPTHTFTRGMPMSYNGVPYKSISFTDDGTDLRSETRIYGSENNGKEKVLGVAKNDFLISKGIKKRKVLRSYNDDSSSKYSSSALKHVREYFRHGIEIEIVVKSDADHVYMPNTTARLIDAKYNINATWFIKGVCYQKSPSAGSTCTIRMIPDDITFKMLWENQGSKDQSVVSGLSGLSMKELMDARKGGKK